MIFLSENVYKEIAETLGRAPAERGGVLGSENGGTVIKYYYDSTGISTGVSYSPDCDKINSVLENEWAQENVQMVGIIHSHDNSCPYPSCSDIRYAEKIMRAAKMDTFYLPIVCTDPFKINAYSVRLLDDGIRVIEEEIRILGKTTGE